jgi:anti-sigma regulatory factor (Ser/Thr protein kinase)
MEGPLTMPPLVVTVEDASHVSAARLALQRMARDLEFDETRAGRLAIVATEAVTNMVRHGGGGTLAARPLARDGALGIEMLAIDAGPGMRDFGHSARDGVSSGDTPGTGLGAIGRLADEFEVSTGEARGTILRMVVWNKVPSHDHDRYDVGGVLVPQKGETLCGDAWAVEFHDDGATFVIADGLGHGPDASRAAAAAVDVLRRHPAHSAIRLLDLAHGRLRATRGAALAFMRHDRRRGQIDFAGVGNIAASILDGASGRSMVSHNGIVGHNVHKSEMYSYPWPPGALLVAHTDGLETQWDLGAFPGILTHHPSVIAAALFRRHSRKRDDVAVLVARQR